MNYICSFPKCGRTWLRYTLAQYCQLLYETDLPIGFEHLGEVFFDYGHGDRDEIYDVFPRVMFSHSHPFQQAKGKPKIILIRHFLDTMVSYHHHLSLDEDQGLTIEQNVNNNLMTKWVAYMKSWVGSSGETLWVKYEDLGKITTWKHMLKFMSIDVDANKIREAMEKSTFDRMLNDEKKHPISKSTKQNHRRVRKGKVNGWRDEISLSAGEQLITNARSRLSARELRILEPLGVFKL